MSTDKFTEDSYEQTLIQLFTERLGYEYECGYDVERDYREPFHREDLQKALRWLNPKLSQDVLDEALRQLSSCDEGGYVQRNETFTEWLQNGLNVPHIVDGREVTDTVCLMDFEHPDANKWKVVNQWRVEDIEPIRCDLVVMVNGLPLVVIELKSPSKEEVEETDAYRQLQHYMQKCPSLFAYNAFCVTSDMLTTKAGTITASEKRFMEWKTKDGTYESTTIADYETFFEGIFLPRRLADIIQNFICFDHKDGKTAKIMSAYHQYFAVNKAVDRTNKAQEGDGKIGVFWHTQGSGKSLSMVFYAHKLIQQFPTCTILVVTDRNDLDLQLYEQFGGCEKFLRMSPQRIGFELNAKGKLVAAEGGGNADLKKKLNQDLVSGGLIFTTIQKFREGTGLLSERRNIVVMTDEAHRSQYGDEHFDSKAQKLRKGFALIMREALPNAMFIGFTGTPISERDRDTEEVFGDYIDVYDMTQAVADGATRPVYYESRVIKLNLDDDVLHQLDVEFAKLADEGATAEQIEDAKHLHSGIRGILNKDTTIESLCQDIVTHYEENRQHITSGKAMIVALDKEAAVKIYRQILKMRPAWVDMMHVVVSSSNKDNPDWADVIRPKKEDGVHYWTDKEFATLFKDDNSPMKIAIVVDMWLTGFDVPSLATMYVYKPMRGHNLMQAIARVNRVFPEKEGGLVVDYVGIASALKQAMQNYTKRDRQRFGNPDIKETALNKFKEKLEVCQDLMHGYDYTAFINGTDTQRAALITSGVNFMLSPQREQKRKDFMKESQLLHNAQTLCCSLLTTEQKREVAFMDAVRVLLSRYTQKGKISKKEINERISTMLEQSIQSEGVVNLFADVEREFSLFDDAFIEEIRNMKEKNIAVQLLEKLLKERIHSYERINVVQSQKFSDLMNQALSNYLKGMLTNEEVIEELLKMAQAIKQNEEEGNELGLSNEEKAFYDALTSPEGIKEAYSSEQFKALTIALTEQLRKNRTIDWNKKDSARASMRRIIKRLLREYHYPPEGYEQALATVMKQCEKWAEDEDHLVAPVERKSYTKKAQQIQMIPKGSMLEDVEADEDVRRLVHNMMELYEGTTIDKIYVECQKEYQERYFSMKGNDWRHLIRDYVRGVTKRPELQEEEVFRYVMAG